ncbi:MAG: carboxypeptidase-like regulatory domain-containing protein [Bryobacterales bacterium]
MSSKPAKTGPQGHYRFPLLPPGNYRIEIRADGFRGVSQTGLCSMSNKPPHSTSLEIGAVTETIEVIASAPLIESENATVGQVVDNKSIVEMPLNGRAAWNLVQLAGATTFINGASETPPRSP